MDAAAQEAVLKKRLGRFLQDLHQMGTVTGFKHFSTYVRGREELVVHVNNSLESGDFSNSSSRRPSIISHEDSLTSSQLPYDKAALVLSHNTQMGLSGRRERGIGLPPASPSEKESCSDRDSTMFLVAGYGRYACPYVWVRSNHERLFKLSGDLDNDRDSPLRLKSTSKWAECDVQASDIIAELVRLCMYPHPRNPFEVDLSYFLSLPRPQQLLASAAMVSALQHIVVHTSDDKFYAGKVSEDLQHIGRLHFKCLRELTESNSIPILRQPSQQAKPGQGRYHQPSKQGPARATTAKSGQTHHQLPPAARHASQPPAQQQPQPQPLPLPQFPSGQQRLHQQQQQPPASQQSYNYPQVRADKPQSPPQYLPPQQQSHQLPGQYPTSQQRSHQPPPVSQLPLGRPQGGAAQPLRQSAPYCPPQQHHQQHGQPQPPQSSQHHRLPPPRPNPAAAAASRPPQQPASRHVYGQGPRGAFPGGFERTPAPSLF